MSLTNPTEAQIAVTTHGPAELRHLVEPYSETPTVEVSRRSNVCAWCGNRSFRRSRLRVADLLRVVLFRYPVRCTRCSQRQFVSLPAAMRSYGPKTPALDRGSSRFRAR